MSETLLGRPAAGLGPADVRDLLDRQTEVLELIAGAAPLGQVLEAILTSLEHLMPFARCSVLLLDREQGTLHHGAAPSLPARYVAAIDGMAIGTSAGSCGAAASTNAPVVATDVRVDPRWTAFRELAEAAGLRSCWSTPIEGRDGEPVGTFAVYHGAPHGPTPAEKLLVDRFTHLAAVAIDHAGLLGDLVESEERFRRSFADNALGMAIVGLDRTVTTSNNALELFAGGRLVGRSLPDLLTSGRQSWQARLDEVDRADAESIGFEARLHCADRPDIDVDVTVSLLRGRDGDPAQYVVNVLDLTERRAAERERRARLEAETARRTAEELSHAKSELLAAVGHEVRTPIQAIVGFAELLGTIDLDPGRRREALDRIAAAAGHVMDLLADVLDLSRVEANALPVTLGPVRVRQVTTEVFGLLSSPARQRRVELVDEVTDDLVLADGRRLRQVLLNLVGNAVRHGNSHGTVTVRNGPTSDPGAVVISVDDDGPGIPAELLPRVFTPFARAATTSTLSGAGSAGEESVGLGLGLAQGLMRAMDGDLVISRSTSTGTSMTLRIPRALPEPPPVETGNHTDEGDTP